MLQIYQFAYTLQLLERLGIANSNPRDLLIPAGTVLQIIIQDNYNKLDKDQATIYYIIVSHAIYLSNITWLDIAYPTSQLARMIAKPNTNHLLMAKGLLRYLKGIAIARITYKLMLELRDDYIVQSDIIQGTKDNRKSFQGYILVQHRGSISWTANRQKSIAQSIIKAKICAGSEGAR